MKIEVDVDDSTEGGQVTVIRLRHYVSQQQFQQAIADINRRLNLLSSQEQQDVDALTAAVAQQGQTVAQVSTDLQTSTSTIQTELNNLEAQIAAGQPANLDALKAAVQAQSDALAPLDGVAQAIGALVPQPPAPSPGP